MFEDTNLSNNTLILGFVNGFCNSICNNFVNMLLYFGTFTSYYHLEVMIS